MPSGNPRPVSLVLGLVVVLAGCSNQKPPEPVPYSGKVTNIEGRKLVLSFRPQETVNKHSGDTVVVDSTTGEFKGKLVPGLYHVTVGVIPPKGAAGGPSNPGTTPLPPGEKLDFPADLMDANKTPLKVTIPPEGKDNIEFTLPKR